MAITNSPYDPDEIRRRQLLAASMDSPPPTATGEAPDITAQVMGDDEGDAETSGAYAGVGAGKPGQLSPAQQKYRQTVESMPLQENYAPSKWRRFGAAVAGGLAGMKDAGQGIKTAQGILEAPHQEAQQDWASRVNREALSMGLDEKVAAQDIARQRANSYAMSAQARANLAAKQMADIDRKAKEPQEYKATTKQDVMDINQSKLGPHNRSWEEIYAQNPELGRRMKEDEERAKALGKVLPDSYYAARAKEASDLQAQKDAAALKRHTTPGAASAGKPVYVDPQDMGRAKQLATGDVIRTAIHPEYKNFYDPGDPSKNISPRMKRPDEISGDALTQALYKKFLFEVDQRTNDILNTTKGPTGSAYDDPTQQEE